MNEPIDLIHLYISEMGAIVLEVAPAIILVLTSLLAFVAWYWNRRFRRRFKVVRLNINLGGIGSAELRPTLEDVEIAHRIWTELVTRKAAIPFEEDHDVIAEVYDSWYAMFGRIRSLIGDLPPHLVRNDDATKELIRIATDSLNLGLRPHLTRWQARFRNWYEKQDKALKTKTPQEVQRDFPDYEALIADLKEVNENLMQYSSELHKISQGS